MTYPASLPPGWAWSTIGDVTDVLDHMRVPLNRKERAGRPGRVPYYGATGLVDHVADALFDEPLVLLGEDGAPFLDPDKPKAYCISGPSWVNNHAHVLRPRVNGTYLKHFLDAFDYRSHANGTTRLKLTKSAMTAIPVAVPPAEEQIRIVGALEEHLSLVDAATDGLERLSAKLAAARARILDEALAEARLLPLKELLAAPLTNGRSVRTQVGGFPVLRLTALRDGRIDLAESKPGAWTADEARPWLVEEGDFLVARGNGSLRLVGRGGLVGPVHSPVAYPDTLIRVRPDTSRCDPEYLRLVWESRGVRGQIEAAARTTAGIYKVNQKDLEAVELPLPDRDGQRAVVRAVTNAWSTIDSANARVEVVRAKTAALRRSLLAAAVAGRLVEQNPSEEAADLLLKRIAEELAVAGPAARRRRARSASSAPTSPGAPPVEESA